MWLLTVRTIKKALFLLGIAVVFLLLFATSHAYLRHHFSNFLVAAWDLFIQEEGTTSPGFFSNIAWPLISLVVAWFLIRKERGKVAAERHLKEEIKLAVRVVIIVALLIYGPMALWCVVRTTYDDHHNMASRWQAVVKEKDNLKSLLGQRDDYIKRLEVRPCPTCPSNRHAGPLQGPTAPETIHDVLAEVRITCRLTNPSKMPDDMPWMMPGADETYFEGASGKSYLQSRAASYKRTEEEGKVAAIENFKLPPNSDLIGRPISVLADYSVLRIAAMSVGVGEISECVAEEVALRVNGQEILRSANAISIKMDGVHGLSFGIELAGMNLPK
jgi:hypothetical protein